MPAAFNFHCAVCSLDYSSGLSRKCYFCVCRNTVHSAWLNCDSTHRYLVRIRRKVAVCLCGPFLDDHLCCSGSMHAENKILPRRHETFPPRNTMVEIEDPCARATRCFVYSEFRYLSILSPNYNRVAYVDSIKRRGNLDQFYFGRFVALAEK